MSARCSLSLLVVATVWTTALRGPSAASAQAGEALPVPPVGGEPMAEGPGAAEALPGAERSPSAQPTGPELAPEVPPTVDPARQWPAHAGRKQRPLDYERPPRVDAASGSAWYGWQTLTADAISIALVPLGVGVLGFWFATPIVHEVHGNYGTGAGSAMLRVAGTLVPALLWMANCFELDLGGWGDESWDSASGNDVKGHDAFCDVVLPAWGILGVLGSITLDAAVLAYEDGPSSERSALNVQPWATASGDGGLAVRGRF